MPSGETHPIFSRPAGGSRTRKGAFAFQENTIWLVETEIAFSVEQQYFSRTTSGANCGKSDRRIFEKYFHKNGDISSSCRQILLRRFQSGAFCMQIQILKTRGLGKFCSSRTSPLRVGEMDQIFGKVASGQI